MLLCAVEERRRVRALRRAPARLGNPDDGTGHQEVHVLRVGPSGAIQQRDAPGQERRGVAPALAEEQSLVRRGARPRSPRSSVRPGVFFSSWSIRLTTSSSFGHGSSPRARRIPGLHVHHGSELCQGGRLSGHDLQRLLEGLPPCGEVRPGIPPRRARRPSRGASAAARRWDGSRLPRPVFIRSARSPASMAGAPGPRRRLALVLERVGLGGVQEGEDERHSQSSERAPRRGPRDSSPSRTCSSEGLPCALARNAR